MHVQLKALTNHLEESLMRQYLLRVSAFSEREKNLADVVLQVIVNSNMEKVQKWKGSERIMCEALRVLMADELNEERVEGRIEGQREGKIRPSTRSSFNSSAIKTRNASHIILSLPFHFCTFSMLLFTITWSTTSARFFSLSENALTLNKY